jgi:hypothetical protein
LRERGFAVRESGILGVGLFALVLAHCGGGDDSSRSSSDAGVDATGGVDAGADAPPPVDVDAGDAGDGGDSGSGGDASHDAGDDAAGDAGGAADGGGIAESGATTDSGDDGGGVGVFPFPPVTALGGPVVTVPKVVSITFSGDTLASQLATFGSSVASSSYWDTIRAGYCVNASCVGDGPAGTSVLLNTAPSNAYTDSTSGGASSLQTFLKGLITTGQVPAPDANTVYTLYFPSTTTISQDGAASCQSFDGYHNFMTMGSQTVVYAVVAECPPPSTPPISLLQNTTITASHELIEASTDPSSTSATRGFNLDLAKPATWGWADVQGSEIADLCDDPFGLGQDETTEDGFMVQRIWSMDNAAAGKNPCVPIPSGEVYFNAYSKDSVVILDVGQSKTIEVDALADGAMAPWTVIAQDWTDPTGATQYLTFTIQGGTSTALGPQIQVKSGDRIQLTVTMVADPVNAQNGEGDAVLVSANGTSATATAAHFWPFVVMTSAQASKWGVTMMRRARRTFSTPRGTRQRFLAAP